ncbi:MAG: radical SAM family heme chaperone HemW [Gammaproteobacteria bacterium]|nr:radical SAM family heme chaperone HemW [Gammaproteobacteria bacterium]
MRQNVQELPPLSLYVHLPWCVRKCPYCDFNSHRAGEHAPYRRYTDVLLQDIASEGARARGRQVVSVFLGGGTPSLFEPSLIVRVLDACRNELDLAADCEITMEANPGTVEHGSLGAYAAAGVSRLSIGAQSFNEQALRALGRIHGPGEIHAAYEEAKRAGFASINLDLMFALPGQTLDTARADVSEAIALSPAHISYYQLTLEPNTVFHQKPPDGIPGDELVWEMQIDGQRRLVDAGYAQYEVSAFAKEDHRCRHNLNYWEFGDYLAVGAGAHGKFTYPDGRVARYRKNANPLAYMERLERGQARPDDDELGRDDLRFEFMLNALRLTGGFRKDLFAERTGLDPADLAGPVSEAVAAGLLLETDERWQPTADGLRFLNDLQARFLP